MQIHVLLFIGSQYYNRKGNAVCKKCEEFFRKEWIKLNINICPLRDE